jgi:hypothetical protein
VKFTIQNIKAVFNGQEIGLIKNVNCKICVGLDNIKNGSLEFIQFDSGPIFEAKECQYKRKFLHSDNSPDDLLPEDCMLIPPFDIIATINDEDNKEFNTKILGVKLMHKDHRANIDDLVAKCNYAFTASEVTTLISTNHIKEDHTGQTYNQYTDIWSWL